MPTLTLTFALLLAAGRNFFRLVKSDVILLATEYDFENSAEVATNQTFRPRALFRELAGGRFAEYTLERLRDAKTFEDVEAAVIDAFGDSEGFQPHALVTPEEAERRGKERERRRLEKLAADIARRHGVEVSSVEFIRACESELRRFRDYRTGLREDGLCIGYGVTHEQWSEEFSASVGDSATVADVLAWLRSECPLLCAQADEAKLRGEDLTAEGDEA